MTVHDASSAQCYVFTYKDGLLARAAHDLRLGVGRFSVDISDENNSASGTFDATSLTVLVAVSDGGVEETLKASDQKKIGSHINKDVLQSAKHPEINFVSTKVTPKGEGYTIEGNLSIKGRQRLQSIDVVAEGDHWVAYTTIHQPDFGITPFKALMGAIRIKPDVEVTLRVPKSTQTS